MLDGLMGRFDDIISNRQCSEAEKHPLNQCSVCNNHLSEKDYFVVSKAFHQGKAILEAVQCLPCQMDSRSHTSEQSMENIMLYSGRRFNAFIQDPIQRKVYHLQDPSCLITGEGLQPTDSFELYSFHIPGANLGDENFLFIGPTAMDQMGELLSEETRKSWGKFIETLMPQSPDRIPSPMFFG
jgi:hypothetical protein